ncbi:MAG: hypothetical protein KBF17_04395 [Candidatus Promineofilum sp.]|nr:hypothetical protein [Promineifilum sp.]
MIAFSGYSWHVKKSDEPVGPGPNYFSDQIDDVWVDIFGRLHLMIRFRNGRWYASEIVTETALGYGAYTFTLGSLVDQLDPNVVLGLFTWDPDAPNESYREIDIEFSKWSNASNDNAQYVVQTRRKFPGNPHCFTMLPEVLSTHRFLWSPDRVLFTSYRGRRTDAGSIIHAHAFTASDVPKEGNGNARINLWLNKGAPPSDGQNVEIIVESFGFTPLTAPAGDPIA